MSTTDLQATIARLRELLDKATPRPWMFRAGTDSNGDSCDLLMAEVGIANGEEDEDYAEVLFGNEIGQAEVGANWDLICESANTLPAILDVLEATLKDSARLDKLEKIIKEGGGGGWPWLALDEDCLYGCRAGDALPGEIIAPTIREVIDATTEERNV